MSELQFGQGKKRGKKEIQQDRGMCITPIHYNVIHVDTFCSLIQFLVG